MNRHAKRQDVTDKVKEIKLRQKNWMKQRAECRDTCTQSSPTTEETKSEQQKSSNNQIPAKQKDEQKSSLQNVLSSNKSHAKFQSWVKERETTHGNNDKITAIPSPEQNNVYNSRKYESTEYGQNHYTDQAYRDHRGSKEVNYLRVPSTRPSEDATPDPEWNSDDETGEITQAQLMSPQDFEAKADDIIAKVKGDLGTSGKVSHYTGKDKLGSKTADIGQRERTRYKDTKGYQSSGAEITNHTCPICENLMLPPNYNPMLLIPCGHTLCGQCCKVVKFCGQCSCSIQSFTANIMLQQIISKYSAKPVKSTVPNLAERERYREEYHNLITRQEILHEESNSVKKNIHRLNKKLSQEHQQVENILEEEKMIEAKIQSLQDRLRVLVEHRCEYEQTCDSIQSETKQEKNKLVLIEDTLKSISEQIGKVKKLYE